MVLLVKQGCAKCLLILQKIRKNKFQGDWRSTFTSWNSNFFIVAPASECTFNYQFICSLLALNDFRRCLRLTVVFPQWWCILSIYSGTNKYGLCCCMWHWILQEIPHLKCERMPYSFWMELKMLITITVFTLKTCGEECNIIRVQALILLKANFENLQLTKACAQL